MSDWPILSLKAVLLGSCANLWIRIRDLEKQNNLLNIMSTDPVKWWAVSELEEELRIRGTPNNTIYVTLARLEDGGWLKSKRIKPESYRRMYQLNGSGGFRWTAQPDLLAAT